MKKFTLSISALIFIHFHILAQRDQVGSGRAGISIDSLRVSQMELQDFTLYNFISPDNDDVLNQFFSLDHALQGSHLTVYNRWGKQVYQSVNYQNDWDGGDLPSGIYFYTINGACIETQKGTLTIMR